MNNKCEVKAPLNDADNLYQVIIQSNNSSFCIKTVSAHINPYFIFQENFNTKDIMCIDVKKIIERKYNIEVSHYNGDVVNYTMTIYNSKKVKANSIIQKAIEDRLNSYGYDRPVPDRSTYYTAVRQVIKLRLGKPVSAGNFYSNDLEKALAILDEVLPRK